MADIPIQQRKNRGVIPMIIALIVVVALIWYIMMHRGEARTIPPGLDSTKTGASPAVPALMATHFERKAGSLHGEQG